MREITYRVYKIDEHPNKDKCFDWVRHNIHDLAQHKIDDLVYSLVALYDWNEAEFYIWIANIYIFKWFMTLFSTILLDIEKF